MKYYLIAGEASGDMHGANLMKAILSKDEHAQFRFWGGDKMAQIEQAYQVEHYKNTAFMGFVEVVKHLPKIFSFIKKCKTDIISFQPDIVIFIDYPGFNLRLAQFAKETGFKTVYYISPQVWAWKENRVKIIKKYIDKMLVILPFEKEFYQKWDYEVDFVGHPLLDEMDKYTQLDLPISNKKIIALLPGSRKQEIQQILPEFVSVVKHFPEYQFVVAGVAHLDDAFYYNIIQKEQVVLIRNKTYALLKSSHAALVASGTATLETALFKVPMVVGYKGNLLSYILGKYLVKVPFIALVNLILGRKVVEELIQHNLNEKQLVLNLHTILKNDHRNSLHNDYEELIVKLGNKGASERAAQVIFTFLNI
jgi:lipid-A-disaccharide synthase